MKKLINIILVFIISFSVLGVGEITFAENIKDLNDIVGNKDTAKTLDKSGTEISENAQIIAWEIIDIVRYVFSGILVIFIIYAGIQMIISMGTNEDELSKAKRGLWYSIVGIFFINFPIVIYNMLIGNGGRRSDFFNIDGLVDIITNVIIFLEIVLIGVAIFMIILTGIKLITSRSREEKITEAKNKILWIVVALIFIGFIEVWRNFLIGGDIKGGDLNIKVGIDIFSSMANLALYLAGPVAIFFLTLAGYYYITSSGDDERAKKGKNIVVNTLIGVIILLCAYVLLNDLSLLKF